MSEQALITGVAASKTTEMAAGAVTLDFASSNYFEGTFPAGNVALEIQNLKPGQMGVFKTTQDGGGARQFTYPGTKQTVRAPAAGDLQPAAGAGTITTFIFMGSSSTMATVDIVGRLT